MKVAVYYNNHDIRIEERPVPVIGDGELLVKVRASGLCGTDMMEWYRLRKAPRVFGHEIAGEIVESKSEKYRVGQRVFVNHHVPCNECKYCRGGNHTACETLHTGNYDPGGYSEYVRVPRINVDSGIYILPDDVSYDEGAMIEPLACAVRGQRVIGVKKGQTVLIMGSGVSGLMNIQIAKLAGVRVIATDINEYRLNKARSFGADETVNAKGDCFGHSSLAMTENANNGLNGVTADRVIICTDAAAAVKDAFECIDRKGVILFFAIPGERFEVPMVKMWRDEVAITSTYGAAPDDLQEALSLIQNKKVDVLSLITHRLPLTEIQRGYDIALSAKESLKIVFEPSIQ